MAEFAHNINFRALSPEQKLQILREMDFIEVAPEEHGSSCPSLRNSGVRCDCLSPTTSWKAPSDVRRYMGETREARQAFDELRSPYLNDGEGESPGLWVDYLEKTAPRYQT
jgi:hypothetical protein